MRLIFPLNFLNNSNNEIYHKPKKIISSKITLFLFGLSILISLILILPKDNYLMALNSKADDLFLKFINRVAIFICLLRIVSPLASSINAFGIPKLILDPMPAARIIRFMK